MRIEVQKYKQSLYDIGLPHEQEAMIWDFYVSKAIAKSASQKRSISDYGQKRIPWKEMKSSAGLTSNNIRILLANSINNTLLAHDLEIGEGKGNNKTTRTIEIDTPKIVCTTPFTIADEEKPKEQVSEPESVLTHIRNSFAHGNTYIFPNGMILLEDKDQRGTITARMLLKVQTLLDWISIIDKESRYYVLHRTDTKNDTKQDKEGMKNGSV